jgi:hypothetical protein
MFAGHFDDLTVLLLLWPGEWEVISEKKNRIARELEHCGPSEETVHMSDANATHGHYHKPSSIQARSGIRSSIHILTQIFHPAR